jgi:hypothetical protein
VQNILSSSLLSKTNEIEIQGGSTMTGTDCGLFTPNQSRSYLNHLVYGTVILPALYGCEAWVSHTEEGTRLKLFEHRVLTFETKNDEVTGKWRKFT